MHPLSNAAQLCASLDAVMLVCAGVACARTYLKLAHRNIGVAGVEHLDLNSLPCSSAPITRQGRPRPHIPAPLLLHACSALSAGACLSDVSHAASRSLVCVLECFSIFDRPHTIRVQEDLQSSTSTEGRALIGVQDHVLSDQAASAILSHHRSSCHFPLVAPNRRMRSCCILQVKIW